MDHNIFRSRNPETISKNTISTSPNYISEHHSYQTPRPKQPQHDSNVAHFHVIRRSPHTSPLYPYSQTGGVSHAPLSGPGGADPNPERDRRPTSPFPPLRKIGLAYYLIRIAMSRAPVSGRVRVQAVS